MATSSKPRQQTQIKTGKVAQNKLTVMRVLMIDDLAADVLQRTHPVPIGGQAVKGER